MKNISFNKTLLLLLLCFVINSCTEQYVFQNNTFEDALVVEATITNELKKQEIKLSRTYRLEDTEETFESGATVMVTDNLGNSYLFEEQSGKYLSETEFQAEPNRTYQLNITTENGKTYSSSQETLTTVNNMESVIPTVTYKDGQKGVQINVNSYDPNRTSKYYRYEFEETYKIIAPYWDSDRAYLIPAVPGASHPEIGLTPRVGESKTCYSTDYSKDIILTSTVGLIEDRVNFPVRFISNQNYIIMHRYSILVRQYIQNLQAYTYYKTLRDLSGSESILSQNQPGFFYGNIKALENSNEKVIGFFEVASVSSQRIFFNYTDLFPGEPLPPYVDDCDIKDWVFCFESTNPDCKGTQLIQAIGGNTLLYLDNFVYPSNSNYQVYRMVPPPCGDCTTFSSNVIPPFWIN